MKKRITTYLTLLLCLIFAGCGRTQTVYFDENTEKLSETAEEVNETAAKETAVVSTENAVCFVYVCGAVERSGVYEVSAGDRIYKALELAGGLSENACEESVNQAEEVFDGQMIKVLTKEEAAENLKGGEEKQAGDTARDGKINLNTADKAALMTISGIGEAKAESILAYRNEHGNFTSIEDVKKITGIKDGVYEKMKNDITVN